MTLTKAVDQTTILHGDRAKWVNVFIWLRNNENDRPIGAKNLRRKSKDSNSWKDIDGRFFHFDQFLAIPKLQI